jgi:branched-chain amino acid transport system permease protein
MVCWEGSTDVTDRIAITERRSFRLSFPVELGALVAVALIGIAGYVLFPDDLAFLTRLIGIVFLVLSLDLVTGYCGIATLGQSAIFGVSAYVVGNACLAGLVDPVVLLGVGVLAGAVMGLASGVLVARFHGLPQLVLSIAIGQLVAALANKLSAVTGGSDGLSGISPAPVFGIFNFDLYGRTGYVFSLVVLVIVFVVLLRFVRSPFGLLCRAIKDDSLRAKMMGVQVYPRLIVMYGISGAVAGIGGALTAINTGVIGLDSVSFERSAEALVMLVIGGAGSLWGALLGSVVFQIFAHYVSAANPFHWMTILGLMLIVVVLFAPRGLVSLIRSLVDAVASRLRG